LPTQACDTSHSSDTPLTHLSCLLHFTMVLSFILIQNRQGKTRLAKWYAPYTDEEKVKLKGEVCVFLHLLTTQQLY
jgi:hypothetical protein